MYIPSVSLYIFTIFYKTLSVKQQPRKGKIGECYFHYCTTVVDKASILKFPSSAYKCKKMLKDVGKEVQKSKDIYTEKQGMMAYHSSVTP